MSMRTLIVQKMLDERGRQDVKWGPEHDKNQVPDDFIEHIRRISKEAEEVVDGETSADIYIKSMIEIGALAIAAIEHAARAIEKNDEEWYSELEKAKTRLE